MTVFSLPKPSYTSGATILGADVIANFNAVRDFFNNRQVSAGNIAVGGLNDPTIHGPASVPRSALVAAEQFPIGAVVPYAAMVAPAGWLLCQGQPISRTTYASLFAAIGGAYGAGDGSTTFNVPDLQGRVPVGVNTSGPASVSALAANEGAVIAARTPKHYHTPGNLSFVTEAGTAGGATGFGGSGVIRSSAAAYTETRGLSGNTDDQVGPVNAPAYQVLQYIIKT